MTIKLYKNLSESNVVDKDLTEITTLVGALREGTSILNPVITIEGNFNFGGANYLWIEDLARYYFIQDIILVTTTIWEITCHVDVLSTYKEPLRRLSAILARHETLYNLYLEDERLLTTSRRMYWTKAFPTRVFSAKDNPNATSFIFTCAGGAEISDSE